MSTNCTSLVVQWSETRLLIAHVGLDHCHHLLRIDLGIDGTDTVARRRYHEWLAIRRNLRNIYIVHTSKLACMCSIQLDDDLIGHLEQRRADTHRS